MQKIRTGLIRHAAGAAGLLALGACGGGGGSGGVTPPPAPQMVQLVMRGQIVDAAIPNAAITVTVGGRTFTTTADSSGNYSVTMTLPPDETGNIVTVTALGAAGQPNVALTSTLGSFSTLMTQAGSDGTLTRSENDNTNVTNLTTAIDALVMAANGGTPVTSDQQLIDALKAIDPNLALDIAAAIKLVIDTGVALPAGVTDTRQLATTTDVRTSFIADQQTNNSTAFDQARSDTTSDPAIVAPTTTATVPAKAYALVSATTPSQNLFASDGAGAEAFEFDAGGTGRYWNGLVFSNAMQWSVDGSGTINVSFTQNPVYSYSTNPIDPATGSQISITCTDTLSGVAIKRLTGTAATVSDTISTTCSDTRFNTSGTVSATELFVTPDQLQPITAADLAGSTYTLAIYEPTFETGQPNSSGLASDFVTFNADGTGSSQLRNRTLTWTLSADGTATVVYSNGVTASYRIIRSLFNSGALVLADFVVGSTGQRRATGSISWDADGSAVADAATTPGVYYQYGVGPTSFEGTDPRLKGFALEFTSDGRLAAKSDYIADDGSGTGTTARFTQGGKGRNWVIHGDGSISAQQHYSISANRIAPDLCAADTTSTDCVLLDRRDIFPASTDGTYVFVLERRTLDFNNGVSASTPTTYLSRFYEIAPVGDYELARAAASTGATPAAAKTDAKAARSLQKLPPRQ